MLDPTLDLVISVDLQTVRGGQARNTGITGGMSGVNNQILDSGFPPPARNTGITGGLTAINNKIPADSFPEPAPSTCITGGMTGINNNISNR